MIFHFLYNVGLDIFCEIASVTFLLESTSSQTGTVGGAPRHSSLLPQKYKIRECKRAYIPDLTVNELRKRKLTD